MVDLGETDERVEAEEGERRAEDLVSLSVCLGECGGVVGEMASGDGAAVATAVAMTSTMLAFVSSLVTLCCCAVDW